MNTQKVDEHFLKKVGAPLDARVKELKAQQVDLNRVQVQATASISGFATLTLLTKNSFLDEIQKQYVISARNFVKMMQRVLLRYDTWGKFWRSHPLNLWVRFVARLNDYMLLLVAAAVLAAQDRDADVSLRCVRFMARG